MNSILAACLGIVSLGMLIGAVVSLGDMPIVYMSFSQQDCVGVDDPAGKFNCENLPPRYIQEWVK